MTVKKFLDNFEEYFCVWTMAIMTILVFIQVVMRYVFSNSLSWSEELARFIFLWLSWIGASYAVKERSHFRVEMFANMIKGSCRRFFEYFVLVVWFVFSFILTWLGTELVVFIYDTGTVFRRHGYPHDLAICLRTRRLRPDVSACLLGCVQDL